MPIRQRMDFFLSQAGPLCVDVARRAVSSPAFGIATPKEDIGLLVVVTSTGFVAPGVDVAIVKGLGLSRGVKRVVVNFMGCAAAMNGIRTAADYAISQQYQSLGTEKAAKKALVVCVELSSVNGVFEERINDVIISSLFGDGCAALVIGAVDTAAADGGGLLPGQIVLGPSFSHLVDETVPPSFGSDGEKCPDGMIDTSAGIILGVNSNGITCDLSPKLPSYIRAAVGPVLESTLAENGGLIKGDIQHWAIHPGGPKIIEESLASLGLDDAVASTSWDVLRDYGNMLSVSLPFVLERMVQSILENLKEEQQKQQDKCKNETQST
ncbi:Thiolase-like protein [Rhypophila decipiens]